MLSCAASKALPDMTDKDEQMTEASNEEEDWDQLNAEGPEDPTEDGTPEESYHSDDEEVRQVIPQSGSLPCLHLFGTNCWAIQDQDGSDLGFHQACHLSELLLPSSKLK